MDANVKVSQIILVWHGTDPWYTARINPNCYAHVFGIATHGSAINLSVSLIIRFGSAIARLYSSPVPQRAERSLDKQQTSRVGRSASED
jgi:hypothetical protein